MLIRPVRGGKVVNMRPRLAKALVRAGLYAAADEKPPERVDETPAPAPRRDPAPPKPAKKKPRRKKYRRRDMRAED